MQKSTKCLEVKESIGKLVVHKWVKLNLNAREKCSQLLDEELLFEILRKVAQQIDLLEKFPGVFLTTLNFCLPIYLACITIILFTKIKLKGLSHEK